MSPRRAAPTPTNLLREEKVCYRLRWAEKADIPSIHKVFSEGSSGLGGPTHSKTIEGFLTPSKVCIVLEGAEGIVGASCSRFPTRGVCYHSLFAMRGAVRGQGLGGGMLAGILRLLASSRATSGKAWVDNPFLAHKWFAVFPEYNKDVRALYQAQKWAEEGLLTAHTRAKTDLRIMAYHLGQPLPAFWHEMGLGRPIVAWTDLLKLPHRVSPDILGGMETPDQGRDGELS